MGDATHTVDTVLKLVKPSLTIPAGTASMPVQDLAAVLPIPFAVTVLGKATADGLSASCRHRY